MDLRGQYKAQEPTQAMPATRQKGSPPADKTAKQGVAKQGIAKQGIAKQEITKQEVATLKDIAETRSEIANVSQALLSLADVVKTYSKNNSNKLDSINTQLETLTASVIQKPSTTTDNNGSASSTGEDTRRYVESRLKEKIAQLEAEILAQKGEKRRGSAAGRDGSHATDEVRTLQSKVEQERVRAEKAEATAEHATRERDEAIADRERALETLEDIDKKWVAHFEESLVAHENIEEVLRESIDREQDRRRQLFDQVQDLKGNIRVMCRIRPAPKWVDEGELMDFGAPTPGDFSDKWGRLNLQATRKAAMGTVLETKTFDFERIFGQEDTNGTVFDEISDLVQSATQGKKVTLFAYGQTGSGKTHTMLGSDEDPGIIPQTIDMMFDVANESPDYRYTVAMSIIEVYQDAVHDLLIEPEHGKKARVRLSEAAWAETESAAAASAILSQASQYRTVAATNANDQSSRSHLIISFQITKEHLAGNRAGQVAKGTLNLVDLAGSERTAAAGATGTQMREGVSINSDLMNLNLVITALGNGTRVPFDSALTKALKGSLEKGSRTLMFVMVSPFKKDQSQTVQTLDKGAEATKAKLASIGRANNFATTSKKPGASPASGSKHITSTTPTTTTTVKACNGASAAARTPSRRQTQNTSIPRPSSNSAKSLVSRLSSGGKRTPHTPR